MKAESRAVRPSVIDRLVDRDVDNDARIGKLRRELQRIEDELGRFPAGEAAPVQEVETLRQRRAQIEKELQEYLEVFQKSERPSYQESSAAYRASVLRDLRWLLNTRRIPEEVPAVFPELRRSLYRYGLRDLTSRSAGDRAARLDLQQDIQDCIRLFEPRLTDVVVKVMPPTESNPWAIPFAIEATLLMDPEPERILFDTTLDRIRDVIEVPGAVDG